MTPFEYIEENYESLIQGAKNITKYNALSQDLLTEVILMFLAKPEAQSIIDKGIGSRYIGQMMKFQWIDSRSYFYRNYRDVNLAKDFELESYLNSENTKLRHFSDEQEEAELFIERLKRERLEDYFKRRVKEWLAEPQNWYNNELYYWRYVKGENVSQIARASQIPLSTLNKHYSLLKKELSRIYQECLDNQNEILYNKKKREV